MEVQRDVREGLDPAEEVADPDAAHEGSMRRAASARNSVAGTRDTASAKADVFCQ
jgi:hypothetical protein